jgi:hypothetical protein
MPEIVKELAVAARLIAQPPPDQVRQRKAPAERTGCDAFAIYFVCKTIKLPGAGQVRDDPNAALLQGIGEGAGGHSAPDELGLNQTRNDLPGWLNATFCQGDLRHCQRLAVRSCLLGFEQVRRLDALQAELALDVADDAFAACPVVGVGHDTAVKADPAGGHVDVVAVGDDGVAVEAHAGGPPLANLSPLLVRDRPLVLRHPERLVGDVDSKSGAEVVELAELMHQLGNRAPRHRSTDDVSAWPVLSVVVLRSQQIDA